MTPKPMTIVEQARCCTLCSEELPLGPRPVFQVHPDARLLIAGQAPGLKVHQSGVPFDDASGDRLRSWLRIDRKTFYDARSVAILPMGFCYPGKGKSGDLPPLKICAPTWRQTLLDAMPNIQLVLVIGQYALNWHVPDFTGNLTEAVKQRVGPERVLVLPHPSPRNNIWLKKNAWFEQEHLPALRCRVEAALG
ncbi:MAG: uracil-DNA glycosylase family protein [Xanthomonadales bacterium]|nr:uracil-DNA glycosylase family protein [Xanthomonadales bacterium]